MIVLPIQEEEEQTWTIVREKECQVSISSKGDIIDKSPMGACLSRYLNAQAKDMLSPVTWIWGVRCQPNYEEVSHMKDIQNVYFERKESGKLVLKSEVIEKRCMPLVPEFQNKDFREVLAEQNALNRVLAEELHAIKKGQAEIKQHISTEVHQLHRNLREDQKKGIHIVQQYLINVTERGTPTSFVLVDKNLRDNPKDEEATKTASTRICRFLSIMNDPVSFAKEKIEKELRDTECIALVCELCGTMVPEDYHYTITQPKEVVGKILPLVKTSLSVVGAVNTVAKLGTCLGVPSVDANLLKGMSDYWGKLGEDDLEDFPALQARIQESYEDVDNSDKGTKSNRRDQGYCVRQFQRWLKQVDPEERWKDTLFLCRTDDREVCFACEKCKNSK